MRGGNGFLRREPHEVAENVQGFHAHFIGLRAGAGILGIGSRGGLPFVK